MLAKMGEYGMVLYCHALECFWVIYVYIWRFGAVFFFFFPQEERKKMIEASLLMDNAKHFRQVFGGTLVTAVLAVYLASGGDFSAFFVFLPQFFSAVWYTGALVCLVCYGNRRARQQREEIPEEEGFNTTGRCTLQYLFFFCVLALFFVSFFRI